METMLTKWYGKDGGDGQECKDFVTNDLFKSITNDLLKTANQMREQPEKNPKWLISTVWFREKIISCDWIMNNKGEIM